MFILMHNYSFIASAAVRAEAGVNTCRLRRVDTVMKSVRTTTVHELSVHAVCKAVYTCQEQ